MVKLILGEIALLFILVVIAAYLGQFLGAESLRDVLLVLLPHVVTIIFVLIATFLFISIIQPFFIKALSRFLSSYEAAYTWQFIKYVIWIAALLILAFVLVGDITSIGILLGILFLIIVIMFYKAFINFAGWLHIIFQHRLRIGDLIEVEGIKGRIVGITIMNTKLIEADQFMGEERFTNREVLIPNSFVYTSPIFTISPKRSLVWDQIKVLLPAKTDHILAKDLISQVGNSIAGPIMRKYRQEMIKNSSSSDSIPSLPSILMSFEEEGITVILTYFCPISERNELRTAITENIIREFKKENIEIAFRDSQT